jgi:hypothetical protein
VPENVSVTVAGVVGVGVVVVSLPHATVPSANATARTVSRLIVLLRNLFSLYRGPLKIAVRGQDPLGANFETPSNKTPNPF